MKRLGGLSRMRPQNYRRIRTFLTEEVKNVKKTMALQASVEAKKNKKTKKGTKKRTVKSLDIKIP